MSIHFYAGNDLKLFRALAVGCAALAFVIAILGSWVRINGAGLTCPDWPLCHGRLIPALEGGVVLEWLHRLVALLEGIVLAATIVTGWRVRRSIAGIRLALLALAGIFVVQVLLGGATVQLSNSPVSVTLHWAMGMALLATLALLALLAVVAPAPGARLASDGPAPALALAAGFAFVTMCLGAFVSSSHAGLVCSSVPLCNGTLFGNDAAQLAQMLHRLAAAVFAAVAVFAAYAARASSLRVRAFAYGGIALVGVQVLLGSLNVVWQLPLGLREAHAANAAATFVAFVVAAGLAALEPAFARARVVRSLASAPNAARVP
jgi:heme A synthase